MTNLKNISLIVAILGGVLLLRHQYQAYTSLDNKLYQYTQEAEVATLTYLEKDRAVQQQQPSLTKIDSALMRMDAHLRAGERLEVLAEGEALLDYDPGNVEALLRQGIVYLQSQDFTLAYEQLKVVYDVPPSAALKAEAAWYLGLLQAQKQSWTSSQRYFKEVLATHSPYRRAAEELLKLVEERIEV